MVRRAHDFDALIELLRLAGTRLRAQGQSLPQRLRTLRGLYYGSPFSLDYARRSSRLRNLGFNLFLQSAPPKDPKPLLGAELVHALQASAVVRKGQRSLDVGHLIIGLEARQRWGTRRWPIPTQGGSGLELATWLGDLGGAAGMLVLARLEAPQTRAKDLLFSPRDYDLRPNLEGDMAAYLVGGPAGMVEVVAPLQGMDTVAAGLADYLSLGWRGRFHRFAPMIGARIQGQRLLESERLRLRLAAKIRAFAVSYTLFRLWHDRRWKPQDLRQALRHLDGAAAEISEIFVGWVAGGLKPGRAPALPDPAPRPAVALRRRWLQGWGAQGQDKALKL